MLGRLYSVIFICAILFSLWYQRSYLNRSAVEFNAQLSARNAVLPTSTGENFNTRSYQDGFLKSSFSGHKIVYLSNGRFEASGNLVYEEYSPDGKMIVQIKTDVGEGEMLSDEDDSSLFVGGGRQLKYVLLPNRVFFTLNGNQGQTRNVYMDGVQRTIQSDSHIVADGEMGHIEGEGFVYQMDDGEFKLKSQVSGRVTPRTPKPSAPASNPNSNPSPVPKGGFDNEL